MLSSCIWTKQRLKLRTNLPFLILKDMGDEVEGTTIILFYYSITNSFIGGIVLALNTLPLLMPDACCRADPDKVIYFTQVINWD